MRSALRAFLWQLLQTATAGMVYLGIREYALAVRSMTALLFAFTALIWFFIHCWRLGWSTTL